MTTLHELNTALCERAVFPRSLTVELSHSRQRREFIRTLFINNDQEIIDVHNCQTVYSSVRRRCCPRNTVLLSRFSIPDFSCLSRLFPAMRVVHLSIHTLIFGSFTHWWYDALARSESSCLRLKDKQSGLKALALKRSLVEARCGSRWAHSAAQLADCMTKGSEDAQNPFELLTRQNWRW